MQVYYEKIPIADKSSFYVKELKLPQFDAPRHFHPEYELMYVLESRGKRFVGDNISDYKEDDLVFLGPNLPHYWHKESGYTVKANVHAIVVQFGEDFPGSDFLSKLEMKQMKILFKKSKQGCMFSLETALRVKPLFRQLLTLNGFERVLQFFTILNLLANDDEVQLISNAGYLSPPAFYDSSKMNKIYQYILKNYLDEIDINEVAQLVNMSKSAFCHYFKKRTRKNFTRFVNEIRIGHANRLLIETEKSISEICFASGYKNLSNFNRRYKEIFKISPKEYRQQFQAEQINPGENFLAK